MALVKSHHQMLASSSTSSSSPSSQQQLQLPAPPPPVTTTSSCLAADQPSPAKRKRRPPGTPDPDAEVVALTPQTLLESDRYVCEICGQGFQREQNLQMHRRRHKVPWRLVKRAPAPSAGGEDSSGGGTGTGGVGGAASTVPRKRVFVCPEPSCLHHDPAHALGDLVGIKKHFRRKHGGRRQWVCARCAKGYAVQSDYKAHLKTCGTRGHSCDCGRVFSRVESFIEHQDTCNAGCPQAGPDASAPACGAAPAPSTQQQQQMQQQAPPAVSLSRSRTASSTSPSSDVVISPVAWPGAAAMRSPTAAAFHRFDHQVPSPDGRGGGGHNLELQLMPPSGSTGSANAPRPAMAPSGGYVPPHSPSAPVSRVDDAAMQLQLSIGFRSGDSRGEPRPLPFIIRGDVADPSGAAMALAAARATREELRQAMEEKAAADQARAQAKRQGELAEQELATAKRMRHQAQVELSRAHAIREHAIRQVNATLLQITCFSCRNKFRAVRPPAAAAAMPSEVACSYVSSVLTEGGDAEVDNVEEHLILDGVRRR